MSPNLAFWVFAYGLTLTAIAIALKGIWYARHGELIKHRKAMVFACNLILFFVVSYVFKMFFLGREDKSEWSQAYLVTLYIHESLIGGMLICGTWARVLAQKMGADFSADPDEGLLKLRGRHARMGKLTVGFATAGLVTAAVVLYGMFARA